MSRVRLAITLAIVSCLVLASCSGDDDGDANGTTTSDTSSTTTQPEDEGDDGPDDGQVDPDGEHDDTNAESVDDLSDAAITLTPVAESNAPIVLTRRHGSEDLFVGDRGGQVRILAIAQDGTGQLGDVIIDIGDETTTSGERGLLGLAHHPDSSRLYVSFTDTNGNTRLDEWTIDGGTVDPGSRRTIFTHEQPFPNHNGGHIAFGPDGYLYLGLGDGGGGGDPIGAGQDLQNALGSIIRIDPNPDGDQPYTIPPDNPFVDGGGRPEIFISGVRNPWRFSWDLETRDLWIADVGQNAIEEITLLPDDDGAAGAGANLGWPIFEGDAEFAGGSEPENYVAPVHTYGHGPGCSITGGFVSRSDQLPGLRGAYLYSDFCDPTIYAVLQRDGSVVDHRSLEVSVPGGQVASFGEGPNGELYVLSLSGGIFRIDPA